MRARLGIDKSKSWADWVDEEEEAAEVSGMNDSVAEAEGMHKPSN